MEKLFSKLKERQFLIRFCFIFLVVAGLIIPTAKAHAWIFVLAEAIGGYILAAFLNFILAICGAIWLLASGLLGLVTSPGFISLPYTSGGIVQIGWTLTRDLANMGFIFALLIIGLATALRYGEYHAKKTLPTLIAMILLVNFTPVICGVIVDASNIVMNFFLEGVSSFDAITNVVLSQLAATMAPIAQILTGGGLTGFAGAMMDLVFRSVALILFCIMSSFFIGLYVILFLMRYVAIWILVILSPFAFFARVLPATRKYFSAWWNQLLQWSFVGVVAAFFLYLAGQLITLVGNTPVVGQLPSVGGLINSDLSGINSLLKYFVVDALLIFGFFASLASGAIGANSVIASAKGWGKSAVGSWKKGTGAMGQAKNLSARAGRAVMSTDTVKDVFGKLAGSQIGPKTGLGKFAALPLKYLARKTGDAGLKLGASSHDLIEKLMKDETLQD
ncbi:MAG: hypothetical protein Q8N56_03560, partial [bacterium]|nr:hypothetical protein [bacterium]